MLSRMAEAARQPDAQALIRAVQERSPAAAAFSGGILSVPEDALKLEAELVRGASAKRRIEFHAGRAYARRALSALGGPCRAIGRDPRRAPQWPPGFVGSISHCDGFCGALVARQTDLAALGLDIETDSPFEDGLAPLISRPGEIGAASVALGVEAGLAAKLIFSSKEAVYKAYAPATGSFLDFQDVEVMFTPAGAFTAHLVTSARPAFLGARALTGVAATAGGWVFAVVSAFHGTAAKAHDRAHRTSSAS